jgi:pimeloyl-ACP methyl ester carboxylesterase
VRKRYVDTDAGQLHLTIAGSGPDVVLLHWTPLSARMYEHELPRLAELGYRAIGVDLPGFGRSMKPSLPRPFDWHADLVAQGLAGAGVERYAVLGAHFSAPIAVELATRDDVDVTALLLDGVAQLLPSEAAAEIGKKVAKTAGPGLHDDGSHRSFLWDQAINAYEIFDPAFTLSERTLPLIYRMIEDYLATGMPEDFGAFAPYDMPAKLAAVKVPSCVLTAETDPLRSAQAPTVAALEAGNSRVRAMTLPGGHPLHDPERQGQYAEVIAGFLNDPKN